MKRLLLILTAIVAVVSPLLLQPSALSRSLSIFLMDAPPLKSGQPFDPNWSSAS